MNDVTLRDYFAAKIIPALVQASATDKEVEDEFSFSWAIACGFNATTDLGGTEPDGTEFKYSWARYYAEEAYALADAMIKARELKYE